MELPFRLLETMFQIGLFVVPLVIIMGLTIFWTNRAQRRAMSRVDEGLDLSRRSARLQEHAIAILEEMLKTQREMLDTLRQTGPRETGVTGIRAS